MSYLDKLNRFASNPVSLDMKRSKFNRPYKRTTTMIAGKLWPIMCDEVLPGDTYNIDLSSLVRSITPAVPVMDEAFLDVFAFWVPARICTTHEHDWQKIHGENFNSAWAPANEATLQNTGNMVAFDELVPIRPNSLAANIGGLPIMEATFSNDSENIQVSVLPFIAYAKIWNEWFRDQNVQAPITDYFSFASGAGNVASILPTAKFHDYFTSALPAPQKGQTVYLPLLGEAPIVTGEEHLTAANAVGMKELMVRNSINQNRPVGTAFVSSSSGDQGELHSTGSQPTISTNYGLVPSNLWADLTAATSASVNQIRQAFAIQRLFERDARSGSRFREMLKAQYGVTIPDNTVQVPEYLGGKRVPLNMQQVIQTSETGTTPLGSTGAFSNTFDSTKLCIKSFAEHGFLMVVATIRTTNTYSQGIHKMWTRNRRFDWYYPVFANLGEQAVKKMELFLPNDNQGLEEGYKDIVFGYQEAWAEYRYKPSEVTGYFAPNAGDTILSSWTYTQFLSAIPTLNSDFIEEGRKKIDNTLVVSDSSYQFLCDFYFDMKCTRVMPYYSIPGLLDHH